MWECKMTRYNAIVTKEKIKRGSYYADAEPSVFEMSSNADVT